MKIPHKIISLLAGTALLAASSLSAVTTDPVGYVTIAADNNTDSKFGVPLEQAAVITASIDTVTGGTIIISSDPSAVNDGHYIQFTSGSLSGQWFQVSASTSNSVTVAEDLETLGAVSSDSFKVVPFWTLSSLFGDFVNSAEVFSPSAQVLLNDVNSEGVNKAPTANYAYHDGSSGLIGAGWYDTSSPFSGTKDDTILAPNTFITVRNASGSDLSIVVAGAVPTTELRIGIVSAASVPNDNLVFNPYPAPIQLSLSGLTDVIATSTNIFSPEEQVIVYGNTNGFNPAPEFNYAYHDGTSGLIGAGWYDVSAPFSGSKDTVEIPANGAFLIRKKPAGTDAYWTATVPYTL